MRVVVLTDSTKLNANYILTHLPENSGINVVGIIETKPSKWSFFKKNVIRMIVVSGIIMSIKILAFFVAVKSIGFLKRIFSKKREILDVDEIAKKYKIPLYKVENINSESSIRIIKKLKPDLIISNHFDQVLKRKVLDIPMKGSINFHPGVLPKYRGIFPNVWSMVNKEKVSGFTIHFITEAIDKGKVLALGTFKIRKNDTATDLWMKSAKKGLPALNKVLRSIKKGKFKEIKIKNPKGTYYSFPTKEAVHKFNKYGRKFFSFRKIFNYF
ncbi:MAG: formyltransferase family protein [Patescibacteria group bacterium]|nr:hypothetical protein [Patescibacteria group bacterium]